MLESPGERTPNASPRAKALRRAACIGVVALGCYAGTLRNGFVFDDDKAIQTNPVVNGEQPVLDAFVRNWWGRPGLTYVPHYRPVAVAALAFEGRIGALKPLPFHLANVLLHGLIAVLIYLIARGAVGEGVALGAALFFSVFAAPSEAVEAVVGQADLLETLALLVGLAAHRRSGLRGAAAAIALLTAAVLCKESALVAPAAWLTVDLVIPAAVPVRQRIGRFGAYAAVIAGYFVVRGLALHSFAFPHALTPLYNPLAFAPAPQRVFGAGRIFLERYLAGMIDPSRRLYDCSWRACDVSGPGDPVAWMGLIMAIAPLALAAVLHKRAPVAAAGLAWFCVFFLPFSNIPVPSMTVYAERLLYLPVVGLCVALVSGVEAISRRVPRPALVWGMLGALGVGNAVAVQVRNAAWRDNAALFATGLETAPNSFVVLQNSANEANLHHDWPEAERLARAAIALNDRQSMTHHVLAVALAEQGRTAEAEAEFRRCLAIARSDDFVADFSAFLARQGRYREAHDEVMAQLRESPSNPRLIDLERRLRERLGEK